MLSSTKCVQQFPCWAVACPFAGSFAYSYTHSVVCLLPVQFSRARITSCWETASIVRETRGGNLKLVVKENRGQEKKDKGKQPAGTPPNLGNNDGGNQGPPRPPPLGNDSHGSDDESDKWHGGYDRHGPSWRPERANPNDPQVAIIAQAIGMVMEENGKRRADTPLPFKTSNTKRSKSDCCNGRIISNETQCNWYGYWLVSSIIS